MILLILSAVEALMSSSEAKGAGLSAEMAPTEPPLPEVLHPVDGMGLTSSKVIPAKASSVLYALWPMQHLTALFCLNAVHFDGVNLVAEMPIRLACTS